jgi:hypothetical protein
MKRVITFPIAALGLCLLMAGASPATAQSGDFNAPTPKVLGYQDARSGQFIPLVHAIPDASTAPSTGTIKLTINITIKSSFPATRTILCGTTITATSMSELTYTESAAYTEMAYSNATGTGSTATCTVSVPYSWIIPASSSTDKTSITGGYSVQVYSGASSSVPNTLRYTIGDFLNLTSPPSIGATTAATINVTI